MQAYPYEQRLSDELAKGGMALIIGVGQEQFPEPLRGSPRVIYWDSDSKELRRPTLPANTRAVIFSRFIKRPISAQIAAQAKKRQVFCVQKIHSTGEIARMLNDALALKKHGTNGHTVGRVIRDGTTIIEPVSIVTSTEEPVIEFSAATDQMPPIEGTGRNGVTEFVRRMRPDVFQRITSAECRDLVKVAEKEGIITTEAAIKGVYYYLRAKARPPVVEAPPPPPPAPVLPAVVEDSPESVKLLTRLQQFAEMFDVVAEIHTHIEAVLKENEELKKYKRKYLDMIEAGMKS